MLYPACHNQIHLYLFHFLLLRQFCQKEKYLLAEFQSPQYFSFEHGFLKSGWPAFLQPGTFDIDRGWFSRKNFYKNRHSAFYVKAIKKAEEYFSLFNNLIFH